MSSMEQPAPKLGDPISFLSGVRSNSGKTNDGDGTGGGETRASKSGGRANEWAHLQVPSGMLGLPLLSIAALNAMVQPRARVSRKQNRDRRNRLWVPLLQSLGPNVFISGSVDPHQPDRAPELPRLLKTGTGSIEPEIGIKCLDF